MPADPASLDAISDFYKKALTVNRLASSEEVLERVLAPHFVSLNAQGSKDKAVLKAQVAGLWQLIPNLKWEPQERIIEGSKVVIRSVASGNPKGSFMGLALDGGKPFRVDTIDIHTVEDGRIVKVYHLEDWATAIAQLRS